MIGHGRIGLTTLVLAASTSLLAARFSGSATLEGVGFWHDDQVERSELQKLHLSGSTEPELDVIHVRKIRLEAAPPVEGSRAARVTFEVHNEGDHTLADITVTVSLVEPRSPDQSEAERTIVAGPLAIRSEAVLLPGYSFDYGITLRNISPDCYCVPAVRVVEARRGSR